MDATEKGIDAGKNLDINMFIGMDIDKRHEHASWLMPEVIKNNLDRCKFQLGFWITVCQRMCNTINRLEKEAS